MSEPAVLTEVADGVMTITINRPQAKNAVNKDVAVGIAAALDALDADDSTHVVILTGAGGTVLLGHGSQSVRNG
jgi:enoyl-CoA hydratase